MILSFVTKECNVFIRFDNGVGIGNFGKEKKILFLWAWLEFVSP